jgi:hypothetical protein
MGDKIQFKISNPDIWITGIGTFTVSTKFNVSGNIMSLLYGDDFVGKTDLTGKNCVFRYLFNNCNKLLSAENLILPATKLSDSCYENMFQGCESLTIAPELPASKLTYQCYRAMFSGCFKLQHIRMLATDISADRCLLSWVYGVASSGIFVKASNVEIPIVNAQNDGIPQNWEVREILK